jgi:WD40 repeat protein
MQGHNQIPIVFGKQAETNEEGFEQALAQHKRAHAFVPAQPKPTATFEHIPGQVGPSRPTNMSDSDDTSSDDEPDMNNPSYVKPAQKYVEPDIDQTDLSAEVPCGYEVQMKGHRKGITALALDPKGFRMLSGSNDYNVRMWDFQGMNKSMNSFRIIEPYEGQPINALSYNPEASEYLVCTMGAQAKIYDRDGRDVLQTVKGDMYLSDLTHTRGHTAMIRDGHWNPVHKNIFVTCSLDSSTRIWDTSMKKIGIEQHLPHKNIIKCKTSAGKKAGCTACCFDPTGNVLAISCDDGSLQIYSTKTHYSRAEYSTQNAHNAQDSATSMCFYKDGTKLLTRGADNTMKVWDIRNFKKPLNAWYDLLNTDLHTQVSLSPNDKYILTGTSIAKKDENGLVLLYDSTTFDKVGQLTISQSSVTRVEWHPVLNQIFVGSTDQSIHVLCDPKKSQRGALLCINKQERKARPEDIDYAPDIRTPHALPIMKEENRNRKKKQDRIRQDPILTKKPEMPMQGPGRGGKTSGPGTVTQFIMLTQNKSEEHKEDAREALIALDAETRKEKGLVSGAYTATQPAPIFDFVKEDPQEELLSGYQKVCPGCGLKICRCGQSMRPNQGRSMFTQSDGL